VDGEVWEPCFELQPDIILCCGADIGNTHLEGTATARTSALRPSSLELPVAHHCQGKRQTFDIFAPNGGQGLKSPERKKRGVNMTWDRVFAANALDLSLHKPRSDLNSAEKIARKTAKKQEERLRQRKRLVFHSIV
jgi:hypothetical protein